MPVLKCPACRTKGEVRGTEEFYEVRGRWPGNDYGWPVLKCQRVRGGAHRQAPGRTARCARDCYRRGDVGSHGSDVGGRVR